MSVVIIPTSSKLWNTLITELLSLPQFTFIDPQNKLNIDDIKWATSAIVMSIKDLKAPSIYKSLVYMDSQSNIGKFAVTYRVNLAHAIKKRDLETIKKLLETPITPEIDSNSSLTLPEKEEVAQTLEAEMYSYNMLVDRIMADKQIPLILLRSDLHRNSVKDICIWLDGKYQQSPLWITERDSDNKWCFYLPELLYLVITDRPNPYTHDSFSKSFKIKFLKQFEPEYKIITAIGSAIGSAPKYEFLKDMVDDKPLAYIPSNKAGPLSKNTSFPRGPSILDLNAEQISEANIQGPSNFPLWGIRKNTLPTGGDDADGMLINRFEAPFNIAPGVRVFTDEQLVM